MVNVLEFLRILALNVLNRFVNSGCTLVIRFNSHKPTGSVNTLQQPLLIITLRCIKPLPRPREQCVIINKRDLETKLYMQNTIDDAALTNISRETFFPRFCAVSKTNVVRLSSASISRSYKNDLIKKKSLFLPCDGKHIRLFSFFSKIDTLHHLELR